MHSFMGPVWLRVERDVLEGHNADFCTCAGER